MEVSGFECISSPDIQLDALSKYFLVVDAICSK